VVLDSKSVDLEKCFLLGAQAFVLSAELCDKLRVVVRFVLRPMTVLRRIAIAAGRPMPVLWRKRPTSILPEDELPPSS